MSDLHHVLAPRLPWRADDTKVYDAHHQLVCECRDHFAARAVVAGTSEVNLAAEAERETAEAKEEILDLQSDVDELTLRVGDLERKLEAARAEAKQPKLRAVEDPAE